MLQRPNGGGWARADIVAAELTNCAADHGELPRMLNVVTGTLGDAPAVALADAGYRSEATLAQRSQWPTAVIVALGREGKGPVAIDADQLPRMAAMAAKLQAAEGPARYRRRKVIVEPPNGWLKQVLGFRQFSLRCIDKVRLRVPAAVCGVEPAAHGGNDGPRRGCSAPPRWARRCIPRPCPLRVPSAPRHGQPY